MIDTRISYSLVSRLYVFFLMIRRPTRSTRTNTRVPYKTLFRSTHPIHTLEPAIDGFVEFDVERIGQLFPCHVMHTRGIGEHAIEVENDRLQWYRRTKIGRAHV